MTVHSRLLSRPKGGEKLMDQGREEVREGIVGRNFEAGNHSYSVGIVLLMI